MSKMEKEKIYMAVYEKNKKFSKDAKSRE